MCILCASLQIRVAHWSGWFTYSVIVVTTFLILKVVNTRLHQSLGNDPIPEEEPEQEDTPSDLGALEGEEEGRETAAGGDSKEKQDSKGELSADCSTTVTFTLL